VKPLKNQHAEGIRSEGGPAVGGGQAEVEQAVGPESEPPEAKLPDGIFSYQKSRFGYIWEGLGMENVGIFYVHLEYLTAVWYILW
jgi:hypothetical protein